MSPPSRDPRGNRPPRLKLNKDSHSVHKPSSSAASATSSNTANHRKHPVIIYTSSPKVIRTEAHDFMALVQKLTGLSHANAHEEGNNNNAAREPPPPQPLPSDLSSFEDTCIVNNGDVQLNCSSTSISSNSLLSPSEAVSSPVLTVNAVASVKRDSSEFLYSESPYLLYPELMEMTPISPDRLVHGDYNFEELDDFF